MKRNQAYQQYVMYSGLGLFQGTFEEYLQDRNIELTDEPKHQEAPKPQPEPQEPGHSQPLDWDTFLDVDLGNVNWFAGKLLAEGQQAALVGDGKVGKSLLALDWARSMSGGLPFLGDQSRDPVRVLYVDHENGQADIQSRLIAMGCTKDQLRNLVYLSFPPIRPLDTQAGGDDLLRLVDQHNPQVVILDTISRMIVGKENEADTWLALYRLTLKRLKAQGIASIRLDHFGKDAGKGARGNSAKTQDVDAVWELVSSGGDRFTLTRTHTRTGLGDDRVHITRYGTKINDRWLPGETRHERLAVGFGEPGDSGVDKHWLLAHSIVQKLRDMDSPPPPGAGRAKLQQAGTLLGLKAGTEVWQEVARLWKLESYVQNERKDLT